ncbi:MAG: glycosyltransferase [Anaerolineae bacterium]|jgi:hypothetical protein|nr:glycosyltransferase [Anaerolineae bacterium]
MQHLTARTQNIAHYITLLADYAMIMPKEWALKLAYNRGQRCGKSTRPDEQTAPDIVETGQILRQAVLTDYKLRHQNSGYRFLFQMPKVGVGVIWFQDLIQCLEYTGIPCATVERDDPQFHEKWEAFQPNVFISMDLPEVLRSLDLDYICRYKKAHGCFRFFTPVVKHWFPKPRLSAEDQWRLDLARSQKSVDAYFSMMVDEFFADHFAEWARAGFKYLALPHGCNPIDHYPLAAQKEFDYFMATSHGIDRVKVTWRYMRPILARYYGLWAGPKWSFGAKPIPSEAMPSFYARTRIAPNPLMRFLIQLPAEITDRTFSVAACGTFQITDWTAVTDRFFAADELVRVKGEKEFFKAFQYYIDRPEERNAIALKALRRVFAEHTYFHRIDRLLSFLEACRELF